MRSTAASTASRGTVQSRGAPGGRAHRSMGKDQPSAVQPTRYVSSRDTLPSNPAPMRVPDGGRMPGTLRASC